MTPNAPPKGGLDSERRYRLLAENVSDALWICDIATQRFIYVSPSIEKLRGFTADEVLRQSVSDAVTPASNAWIQSVLAERIEAFQRGEARTYTDEVEQPCKDGRVIVTEMVTRLMTDPDTGRLHVYGTSRDITERKKAERALLRLTQIHRTLSAANEAIARAESQAELLDRVCGVLVKNLGVAAALVFVPDAGRTELRVIAGSAPEKPMPTLPLEEESFSPSVRAYLRREVVADGRFRTNPTRERWLSLHSVIDRVSSVLSLPLLRDGEVWGVLSISSDTEGAFEPEVITLLEGMARSLTHGLDHLARAETLRASEERYRALVENVEDIVYSMDLAGRLTLVSAASDRLGIAAGAARGRSLFDLVHPQDLPAVREAFAEALRGRRAHMEHRVLDAEGRTRFVRTSMRLASGPEGASSVLGVISDRTEQHDMEERLRVAQKMEAIGRLAGGIAHDFNNLLLVIMSYAELAMEDLPEGAPIRADLDEVRNAGARAAGLTRQLLAFSRKQRLRPESLDLGALVAGLEKMLRRLLGEDIDLVFRSPPSARRTRADAGQIEQVIMNLAVNARDAMPSGGTLAIEVSDVDLDAESAGRVHGAAPGRYVRLAVTDTGTGMDEATQGRIFEPFFTTKEMGKGTGLGLATVYGIVKQTGGFIALTSAIGTGTRFEIFLPAASAPSSVAPPPSKQEERLRGREKLLLVEDEEMVRALVRRVLTGAGYDVLAARTGAEALELSASFRDVIDLLVTDIVMPGMNGWELADRITADRPGIQVLFTSGYTADELAQRGGERPGLELLAKPYSANELLRAVREILDRR